MYKISTIIIALVSHFLLGKASYEIVTTPLRFAPSYMRNVWWRAWSPFLAVLASFKYPCPTKSEYSNIFISYTYKMSGTFILTSWASYKRLCKPEYSQQRLVSSIQNHKLRRISNFWWCQRKCGWYLRRNYNPSRDYYHLGREFASRPHTSLSASATVWAHREMYFEMYALLNLIFSFISQLFMRFSS